MRRRLASATAGAALAALALFACRTQETATGSNSLSEAVGSTAADDDPCDGGRRSRRGTLTEEVSARMHTANAFARGLLACAKQELPMPPLNDGQKAALETLFSGFVRSSCGGCHKGTQSYGGLAQFVSNEEAGPEEFYRGIALRHRLTREIVERCTADSPAKAALLERLLKRRHLSEAGLDYQLGGKTYETIAGIPFFTPGTDQEMRSQVMSFLQGGFEVAAEPGDDLHESLLEFIKSGARLDVSTHVCIVRDAVVSLSDLEGLRVK